MSVDVGSAKGYLDLDISGFLSGLKTAQSEADAAGKQIGKSIGESIGNGISSIGKGITSAGTTLTKTVTAPLLGIGAAGLKVATDFEKGMSAVKAISGATGKEFEALKDKAIELGADTAFSASEVAEAMTEMAKAGWNSTQIIDGMGGVLAAAAASGESLGTVSTIVADTITGFGLAAADSTRIADLLTQAANSGTIGINDLGESFKYIAPIAGAMGLDVEDVTTALSAMSMAGIKGSQAGTSLRTMLTRMVKPTKDVAQAMSNLGVSVINEDGTMKSLDDIVGSLRTGFSELTESEKAQYAAVLAGQEGMSGMLSLLNLTKEEYDAISESMANSNGVAEETAAIMQDNVQSKLEQFMGSLESLAIVLSESLLPYIKDFVEWLTSLVDKFTQLDPETQKTILKFGALAIAAGPALVVIGKLVSGTGSLITAFSKAPATITKFAGGITNFASKLGGASTSTMTLGSSLGSLGSSLGGLAAAAGPILAVVAVIAVLVAAFVNLWKNNEDFRNKITEIWNNIKETFNNFTQGIVERINSLGFDFESLGELLKSIWDGFCNFLAPIFEGVFNNLAIFFEGITNHILGIVDFFIAIFQGDWEGAWEAIKGIFENIWNTLVEWFDNILNTLKGTADVVLGWFGTNWEECWDGISSFFSDTWDNIKKTAEDVWNGIKKFFSDAWNGIEETASSVWEGIKKAIKDPINSAKEFVESTIDKIKGFFDFDVSWPDIPMPHFQVSPPGWKIGDLLKGDLPKLGIEWYAKAMNNPMLLTKPTIFGYNPSTGQLLGGGEAGNEVVAGANVLMRMIRQAVADALGPILYAVRSLTQASSDLGYVTYNSFVRQKELYDNYASTNGDLGGKGDTFIFHSPEPIDEIEAAKQMKKAKRELAEGF